MPGKPSNVEEAMREARKKQSSKRKIHDSEGNNDNYEDDVPIEKLTVKNDKNERSFPCDFRERRKKVSLPVGLYYREELFYDVEIQKMTGVVRSDLADKDVKSNSAKTVDVLLHNCVVKIGELEKLTSRMFTDMTVPDRDFLTYCIRILSMGNYVPTTLTCPACEEPLEPQVDLSLIEVFTAEEKGWRLQSGDWVKEIIDEDLEIDGLIRLPNGRIAERIAPIRKHNVYKADYEMFSEIVLEMNGKKLPTADEFQNMDVDILDFIDHWLLQNVPGPERVHYIICSECGGRIPTDFRSADFLFRTLRSSRQLESKFSR